MAVKAINNTTGPDRLVPTLLVYRAYPRISNLDPPAPSIMEQAAAIQKVMAEIVKLQARQTVNNTLYYRNRPNTTLVYNLPLNSKVLIQHKNGKQTRPYCLLAVENEMCCIQLPSRPTSFKSTSIKPYFRPKDNHDVKPDELETPIEIPVKPDELEATTKLNKLGAPLPTPEAPQEPTKPAKPAIKRGRGRPQKHPIAKNPMTENHLTSAGISIRQSPPADISVLIQETPFTDLQHKEINRLLKKGIFTVIIEKDVPQGVYIFNLRFINKIKHFNTNRAFKKSRLIIQAYNNQGKDLVLIQLPTIQQVSQQIIFTLTPSLQSKPIALYLQDIL